MRFSSFKAKFQGKEAKEFFFKQKYPVVIKSKRTLQKQTFTDQNEIYTCN